MQADDFFNAYLVLHENNEALIERLSNSPTKSVGWDQQKAPAPY